MGPEIGHPPRLDDWAGVEAIARTILASADRFVWPGSSEWLRELPKRTVWAASFDAQFRLQEDRLDHRSAESRTMVVVRFAAAAQPLPEELWSLRVRGDWPGRADRLPDVSPLSSRSLRIDRKGKAPRPRHSQGPRPRVQVPWGRHDSLWITNTKSAAASNTQRSDLEAQVGLFLLQTALVPDDGGVRDHVIDYLRRTFRWRGLEDADSAVYVVYDHLLKHKWWADDWRAWRKLVRHCIDGLVRSQERSPRPREVSLSPDEHGRLTADQFAQACHLSRSSIYVRIRAGTLAVARRDGDQRYMIAASLVKLVARPIRRADLVRALARQGRSAAAAEKWVYRQQQRGRSLAEIAAIAAESGPARRKRAGR